MGCVGLDPIYWRELSLAYMAANMEVTFKYFAWMRERIGVGEERATLDKAPQVKF